jgi:hypothetical protein
LALATATWFSEGTVAASDMLIELGQADPALASRLGPSPFLDAPRIKALLHERLPV